LKDLKEMVLDRAAQNPFCWFSYVNGTFVVWSHGPERLRDFHEELSSVHQNIQFTMETERDDHLHFLDMDIYSRLTHANLYLYSSSHHHTSNKRAVHSTLVHSAGTLCDQASFHAELVFLGDIFRQNGYIDRQIRRVLKFSPRVAQAEEKPDSVAFLPHVVSTFSRIIIGTTPKLWASFPGKYLVYSSRSRTTLN
jgi:hypothetical protein